MAIQRRDLLLAAIPVTASLLAQASSGVSGQEQDLANAPFDEDTYRFWTSEVHEPSEAFQQHGKLISHRAANVPNEAEFLFYSSETGFVRAASTEGDTPVSRKLMEKGDAALLLSVDTVRPSSDHMRKIWDQKNGSLRIDLKQAVPSCQLDETLNWSAIASLLPGEQPFSTYYEMAFDPKSTWGQAKRVPLGSGIGFWAWNFTTQPKPSVWTQMMGLLMGNREEISKAASKVLGFGLPAIAKTALSAFNELFGSMLSKGNGKNEWIIRNADTALLATQDARQKHPGRAVALRSGSYLVCTADHTHQLLSGKYQLLNGVVVPTGTSEPEINEAAKSTLPDLSYIAISTIVERLG